MKIALAQISGTPDTEANRRVAARLVADAASQDADLILFPEMSVLEFFPRIPHRYEFFDLAEPIPGPTLEWFQKLARGHGIHIVYNHFERSPAGVFYDTSVVVDRTGTDCGRQRMMHIAEEPGYNEKFYYAPGADKYRVFELEGWRFGIAICYDRHFPEVFRSFIVQGAQLILAPTAVAAQEPFAEVYSIEARAAAVTHGVYIAMANRAGIEHPLTFLGNSTVIDPYGRVEASLNDEPNALLTCSLSNERVIEARIRFPFLRDRRPETYDWLTRSPSDEEPDGDARRGR